MTSHIAVLWMLTALGSPSAASHRLPEPADLVLHDGYSQLWKVALAAEEPGATDVSPAGSPGTERLAQQGAGPEPAVVARPPVPFLRQSRPTSSSPQPEVRDAVVQEEPHDTFDQEAAKAAIERDGYKRVMMLGKASNGAWRAKAYRGAAEVAVRVGSDGTVSAE